MTRLSSPESVLKKLKEVYQHIDELHGAVAVFHKINDKVNSSYESIQQYESQLETQIDRSKEVERLYADTVSNLEAIKTESENNIKHIVSEFHREKEKIEESLELLNSQFPIFESQFNELVSFKKEAGEEFSALKNNLERFKEKLSDNFSQSIEVVVRQQTILQQTLIQDISSKLSGELEEFRQGQAADEKKTADMISSFQAEKLRIDEALQAIGSDRKEIQSLSWRLNDEIARTGETIVSQTQSLTGQAEAARAELRERVNQFLEESRHTIKESLNQLSSFKADSEEAMSRLKEGLESFQDQLRQEMTRQIEELFEHQSQLGESLIQEIDSLFSEKSEALKRLQTEGEERIAQVLSELGGERQRVDHALEIFDSEKEKLEELRQSSEKHQSQLNEHMISQKKELESLITDSRQKLTEALEQNKHLTEDELNRLSRFTEESEAALLKLKAETENFKEETNERFARQFEGLSEQQAALKEFITQEFSSKFSETSDSLKEFQADGEKQMARMISELEREKSAVSERLEALLAEKNEILEIQESISSKTAEMEAHIRDSQQEIIQKTEERGERIEKELKERQAEEAARISQMISSQVEAARSEAQEQLAAALNDSRQMIEEELRHLDPLKEMMAEFPTLKKELEIFQTQLAEKISQASGQQADLQEGAVKEIVSKLSEEIKKAQKASEDKADKRIEEVAAGFEQRFSDIETRQKEMQHQTKQINSKFVSYIEKLARRQNEQQQTVVPSLEKRIRQIEAALKQKQRNE